MVYRLFSNWYSLFGSYQIRFDITASNLFNYGEKEFMDFEKALSDSRIISRELGLFLDEFKKRKVIYENDIASGKKFSEMLVSFWNYNDFYIDSEQIYSRLCAIKNALISGKNNAQQRLSDLENEAAFAEKKWKIYEKLLRLSKGYNYSYATLRFEMYSAFDASWELYLEPKTSQLFDKMEALRLDIPESFKKDFEEEINRVLKESLGESYGKKFTILSRINAEYANISSLIPKMAECISIIEGQIKELNELRNNLIV